MSRSPFAISPASRSTHAEAFSGRRQANRCGLATRIAVNQYTTRPWTFSRDLEVYKAAGISAIGLAVDKIDQHGREEAVELFRRSSLRGSSLNWIAGLTGANGYPLSDVIDEGIETLRLAYQLGVETVVVVSGPRNHHTWKHANGLVRDSLNELADYAERLGIDLALMPMGPSYRSKWSYIRSLQEALTVVDEVGRPNVGLTIHTGHVFKERGLPYVLAEAAPYVRLARLSDCCGCPVGDNDQRWLGQGIVPVTGIAAALDDGGYDGYYEIDVWSRSLWQTADFPQLLKSVHDLSFGFPPPPTPKSVLHGSPS